MLNCSRDDQSQHFHNIAPPHTTVSVSQVAEFGRVAIITKAQADEGCTAYAQGGVCAVLDPLDSVDKHIQDTMVAGAHLNNPA